MIANLHPGEKPITRYDLFQVHPCGQQQRGEMRPTWDGEWVRYDDLFASPAAIAQLLATAKSEATKIAAEVIALDLWDPRQATWLENAVKTLAQALLNCEADRLGRIQQCDRMAADWADFCEAMGVTWDTQEAVACELKARFEPMVTAAGKVVATESEFRSNMPDDWEGDPLTEAVKGLRTALEKAGA